MPIDFSKLTDPVWLEEQRKLREAEQAQQAELDLKLKTALNVCLAVYEQLTDAERSLVRNCQTRLHTFGQPSEKQQKWLLDIAAKHQPKAPAL